MKIDPRWKKLHGMQILYYAEQTDDLYEAFVLFDPEKGFSIKPLGPQEVPWHEDWGNPLDDDFFFLCLQRTTDAKFEKLFNRTVGIFSELSEGEIISDEQLIAPDALCGMGFCPL